MACGHVAVVRQGQCRWPRLAVLVCGAWLLAGGVGAEPRFAASEISGITASGAKASGAKASGAKASGAGDGLLLDPRVLEARILEAMWLLLRDGRAAEAYQLGRSVLTADADSAELLLALAYAAEASGKCHLALRYLDRAADRDMALFHERQSDMIRARCIGPWRREATLSVTAGYRQSLVDRARIVTLRLEPGSALYGVCSQLRGLCDPDSAFRINGARASGIDIWTQLSLGHLFRDGGAWDFAITPMVFVRSPRRRGYRGEGVGLRLDAQRHLDGGRQLHVLGEAGGAHFQQGSPALAIAQRHHQVGVAFVTPHSPVLASRFGHRRHRVVSRWLDLHRRVTEAHLVADAGGLLSGWVRLTVGRSHQDGPGLMPGARSREHEAGAGLRLAWIQIGLSHLRRTERFTGTLPYLAAPHRAKTRRTGMTLVPEIGWEPNLKVVLSFDHRKILSPDPYRPKTTKNVFLTVKYRLQTRPHAWQKY